MKDGKKSVGRGQFTFYRSYYEALACLPPQEQAALFMALCAYALDETEPALTGVPEALFRLIRPTLDTGRSKALNRMGKTKEEQTRKEEEGEKERDKERDKEKECESESECSAHARTREKKTAFPPTLEEITDYAGSRGCPEYAGPFHDYYAAGGWRDSRGTPIRNWRQKFVSWQLREAAAGPPLCTPVRAAAGRSAEARRQEQEARRREQEARRREQEDTRMKLRIRAIREREERESGPI